MAEEHAKFKRFEYRTNSNLVLQREGAAPSANEPTGEPESLRHYNLHRMGDLSRVYSCGEPYQQHIHFQV